LLSIPDEIDIDVVQIFRKSEDVHPIVEAAIAIGAKAVWMQVDIVNEAAAVMAKRAGLKVVMDRCMRANSSRLKNHWKTYYSLKLRSRLSITFSAWRWGREEHCLGTSTFHK